MLSPKFSPTVSFTKSAKHAKISLLLKFNAIQGTPINNRLVSLVGPGIASFLVSVKLKIPDLLVNIIKHGRRSADFYA
tara:strand:- start:1 stop:234 length:234 start_codon:yes stop_codon:yes gene_type:complete